MKYCVLCLVEKATHLWHRLVNPSPVRICWKCAEALRAGGVREVIEEGPRK